MRVLRKWKHPLPKFFTFFDKIICFVKIMCIFALSKDDNNRTTLNLYTYGNNIFLSQHFQQDYRTSC